MGLTPVDRYLQFNGRTVGSQQHIHAQRTALDRAAQHDPGHQRALLHQLQLPVSSHRQWVLRIIRRQIPGIPELTPVAIAPELHWFRKLINTLLVLQAGQSPAVQLKREQTVAEAPALLGDELNPNRIPHNRSSCHRC